MPLKIAPLAPEPSLGAAARWTEGSPKTRGPKAESRSLPLNLTDSVMSSILFLEDLALERDDKSSWSLESLLRLLLKSPDLPLLDLDRPSSLCPSYTPLSLELPEEEPVEA